MVVQLIITLVLVLLFAIFALQNNTPVSLRFLAWETADVSLALVTLLTFIMGAAVGLFATLPGLMRSRQTISQQAKRLSRAEQSLTDEDEA
jgi:uncharacterized integral membrane protein